MVFRQKITDIFLSVYTFPINLAIGKMNRNHRVAFQTKLMKHVKDFDNYASLSFLPVHTSDIHIGRQSDRDYSDTTILLQGPIAEKNGFTVETVELYKKYYDKVRIVISTWENAPENIVKHLRSIGATVLTNQYPKVNGIGNMNYQLVTSLNGVKEAQVNGSAYVWKTRTDQRYYNPCALPCLIYLLSNRRLVMLGGIYNSFVKRVFHISDFMAFGCINEMMRLYSCRLDDEDSTKTKYTHKNQINDSCGFDNYMINVKKAENGQINIGNEYDQIAIECGNPETLITYFYYKSIIDEKDSSLPVQYEEFLKNEIGIVDADTLGFFWLKYDYDSIKQTYFDRMGKLDFAQWCSLQVK